ncbi:MAG: 4Fe-4S binding protein [Treponema sp.]|jgi:epoxyqueuosine reductase QueG|nr:4Fe-4S binding protein [Treponema sp.]
MEKAALEKFVTDYINTAPGNFVPAEIALRPELAGMRIFEEPIFGYADAGDPLFPELKKPEIIGGHFLLPEEWLPGAKTVISAFLPFTERVREGNRSSGKNPSAEWYHARIEGQDFQDAVCDRIKSLFEAEGVPCAAPMTDSRFARGTPLVTDRNQQGYYTSNWSERHAAYICGLGTFGLSRGLITSRGIAGRFISVITAACFEPSPRSYSGVYEYCTRCGACARNCPAGAISPEKGKIHPVCSEFQEGWRKTFNIRYSCGKCQVKAPCEKRIPAGNARGRRAP